MSIAANAVISLADTKVYVKEIGTTNDAILTILINAVSTVFDKYVDVVQIIEAAYTNAYHDGNGLSVIKLPYINLSAITALTENDITLTEGYDDDYVKIQSLGYLKKISGVWARGNQNIKISCTAGYKLANVPGDLQLACMKQVAFEFQQYVQKNWGESSRSFGDGSTSMFREITLLEDVKEILNRYRAVQI